jgi:S1-C subfamily serine protease/thioredoxin-related protein
MGQKYLGLVLVFLLAPDIRAQEVRIENRSEQPFVYQVDRAGTENWSESITIPKGWHQQIPASAPVIVRFQNGGDWKAFQLAPGKVFHYRSDAAGLGQLYDAGPLHFADWIQDFRAARDRAVKENKDIILLVDGSDWAILSIRMAHEIFSRPEFHEKVASKYVLVHVDLPKSPATWSQVDDRKRNLLLAAHFGVKHIPVIFVTDSQGRTYGQMSYIPGGTAAFLAKLDEMNVVRDQIRDMQKDIDKAEAANKLEPIAKLVKFLNERNLIRYYGPLMRQWLDLAREYDGQNAKGIYELAFAQSWLVRLSVVNPSNTDRFRQLLNELDAWKAGHTFKNADTAAMVYLGAARALSAVKDTKAASACIDQGLACHPQNSQIVATLRTLRASIDGGMGWGTGFVVGPGGYLLTNHHVVKGAHKVVVRLPQRQEPLSAEVTAEDPEHDLALLKVELPAGAQPQPLAVVAGNLHRGTKIAVFGYPVAGGVGNALKLTTGIVSAPADETPAGMILLDCRVNPGNSGGPLCDARGNVVGIVTAKSLTSTIIDSYGMARPVDQIGAFLKKHLPGFQLQATPATDTRSEQWDDVDRRVSPAVLMVVRES